MDSSRITIEPDYTFHVFQPQIHQFETLSSTNDYAKSLIYSGINEGTIVIACEQTRGRGRFNRSWQSPRGGLYMSIILKPRPSLEYAPLLGFLCGCATAWAIRKVCNVPAALKWPNDILVGGKKIGGVLSELVSGDTSFVVTGIGLNLNNHIDDLSIDIRDTATTLSQEIGRNVSSNKIFNALICRIDQLLEWVDTSNDFAEVLFEWRRLNSTLGKSVVVTGESDIIKGIAIDIDSRGHLKVLQPSGKVSVISVGDVRLLRDSSQVNYSH